MYSYLLEDWSHYLLAFFHLLRSMPNNSQTSIFRSKVVAVVYAPEFPSWCW